MYIFVSARVLSWSNRFKVSLNTDFRWLFRGLLIDVTHGEPKSPGRARSIFAPFRQWLGQMLDPRAVRTASRMSFAQIAWGCILKCSVVDVIAVICGHTWPDLLHATIVRDTDRCARGRLVPQCVSLAYPTAGSCVKLVYGFRSVISMALSYIYVLVLYA